MANPAHSLRIVPLIVACPLFLQNLDTSVMATALPSIAQSLNVQVLDLNLAITSYLLSLAIFLPASAWLAERFGARRTFCAAVLLFSLGSALCGIAGSLGQLVVCRLLQGMGGAMMVPVGRSILLRTVPSDQMVRAMVWFTIPGAIGRLAGPLFGGIIVTFVSWRWIFLVNIPFGLLGAAMAWSFVDKDPPRVTDATEPFDLVGLGLLALGLLGLMGGLETLGKSMLPLAAIGTSIAVGLLSLALYFRRGKGVKDPILDFGVLRYPTFMITVLGGFPMRVALGAAPFLLPLMFQLGFLLTPLQSGLLTMGVALGSLCTRGAMSHAIKAATFRRLIITSSAVAGCFYVVYGLFTPDTPHALMFAIMFIGGLCSSLAMVSLNTLGYSDIPKARSGHATAMSAMAQQLSTAVGVVLGATILATSSLAHERAPQHLAAADFFPAFATIALLTFISSYSFRRLRPEDGAELRGTARNCAECHKQRHHLNELSDQSSKRSTED